MKGKTILIVMYIIFTIFSILFIDFSEDASKLVLIFSAIITSAYIVINIVLLITIIDYLKDNFNNKVI